MGYVFSKRNRTSILRSAANCINDSIKLNNTTGFTPSTRFFINSPLWYFIAIKNNNDVDPTSSFFSSKLKKHYAAMQPFGDVLFNDSNRIKRFIPWYQKYLQEVSGIKINCLKIIDTEVHYAGTKIITDTSYTIVNGNYN